MKTLFNKHLRTLVWVAGLLFGLSSCSHTVVKPFYTDMNKAVNLRAGMKKDEARQTLGVYPFDILHQQFDGCEIHHYLYQDRYRKLSDRKWSKNLVDGSPVKRNRNDLYLIFRDGELETFFSGTGKDARPLLQLKNDLMYVCGNPEFIEGPVYGCMDPQSLNYDPEATAEDNSCEYCPCDYVKNPWYDANRKCGEPCITEAEYRRRLKEDGSDKDCDICEILQEGLNSGTGNLNIDLHLDGAAIQKTQPAQVVPQVKKPKPNIFQRMTGKNATSALPTRSKPTGVDQWGRTYEQNMALYNKRRRSGTAALIIGPTMMAIGIPLLAVGATESSGALTAAGGTLAGAGVPVTLVGGIAFGARKKYKRRAEELRAIASVRPTIMQNHTYSGALLQQNAAAGLAFNYNF